MPEKNSGNMVQFLNELETRLRSVSGTVRSLFLLQGLGKILIGGFLFFFFSFFLDFLIPDLPPLVRQILLGGGIGGVVFGIWYELLRPLGSSISSRDIAREVEQAYPELNDQLISALDLKDTVEQGSTKFSKTMVQKLISDLEDVVSRIRLSNVLSYKQTVRWLGTGLLCVVLFSLFAYRFPRETSIWMQRLTGQEVQWPRATLLTLETDKTLEMIEGKNIELRASVDPSSSKIPEQAKLLLKYRDNTRKEINVDGETDQSTGRRTYSYTLKGVRNAFTYRFQGGDGQTQKGSVRLLKRPRIDQLSVRYDYPDYTQKKDTPENDPVEERKLSAPFDTVASVTASLPSTVKKARAFLTIDQNVKKLPVSLEGPDEEDNMNLRTSVPFKKDGRLFFELYLKQPETPLPDEPCVSLVAVCSTRFTVKTTVDLPAQVKIQYPGRNKHATPRGEIPVRTKTEDDFGVKWIRLEQKVNESDPRMVDFKAKHNDKPYKSKSISSSYTIEMKELGVGKGDRVRYRVHAKDVGSKNDVTKSKQYQFSIVTASKMEEQLQKLQEKIRDRMEKLRNDQVELKQQLSYNLNNFQKEENRIMSSEADQQLTQRRNKQRSLAQKMKRINDRLQTLYRDATYNKLWDKRSREKLKTIFDLATTIQTSEMPPAADELAKSLNAAKAENRLQFARNGLAQQNQTLNKLNILLNLMEEWKNLADFVHDWKNLRKDIRQLREDFIQNSNK